MDDIARIKELTKELLYHCHLYYDLDAPKISDIEFDKKFDYLKQLEDKTNFWLTNSPTRKVQGEMLPYLKKIKHSVPMLSADKSTNINDIIKFINGRPVVISFKEDGATLVVKYVNGQLQQAITRGSGIEGEIVTHTAKMIKNLPMTIPYKQYLEVRGEAVIPWKYYNEMNLDGSLGHPRNIAAGGLRQLSAQEAAKRNIYFYAFTLVNWADIGVMTKEDSLNFLSNNGFDVVPHILFSGSDDLAYCIKQLDRETYEIPTDGWCFEYNDLAYGEGLGSTGHHDRKLYALKPEVEEHTTIFRKISYNTCRTGVVSLTAMFDPIEIDNTIVSRATLHNVDFFKALELGTSDEIVVTKMNCIIPGILDNHTRSNTYELIDTCPSCGTKLVIKNTGTANVLYCPNENCPARNLARFEHFVSKKAMDIQGLSSATLELLILHGYLHNFRDIYHLSEHTNELYSLEGLGKKSVQKLLQSIEKSRNVTLDRFITALGIPNVGSSAAKAISKKFNGNHYEFVQALSSGYDFSQIDDFGEITNKSLHDWFDNKDPMVELLPMEMNFIVEEEKPVTDNPFIGKNICVTGKLEHFNRDSINEKIVSFGAKVASGVTSKTDFLITNTPDSGSSKNVNAKKFGTKIITEEDFLKMINAPS